jgi:hypothetical protein
MTPEEIKYFDDARDLFMTAGWKEYMEEMELSLDAVTLDACNTAEEFWLAKGRLEGLRLAVSYEARVKMAEEYDDA